MKSSVLIYSTILAASAFLVLSHSASAAFLYMEPASAKVQKGQMFSVKVGVDTEGQPVTGTDVYIQYDQASVKPAGVEHGTYFPFVSDRQEDGKVSVSGVVLDPKETKNTKGAVATVKFTSLNGSSGSLSFYCDTKKSNTSKIVKSDVNATNLIDCSKNTAMSYQGSGSGGGVLGAIAQFFAGLFGKK